MAIRVGMPGDALQDLREGAQDQQEPNFGSLFSNLPPEVHEIIFAWLPAHTKRNFRLASRKLREMLDQSFTRVCITRLPTNFDDVPTWYEARFTCARVLSLAGNGISGKSDVLAHLVQRNAGFVAKVREVEVVEWGTVLSPAAVQALIDAADPQRLRRFELAANRRVPSFVATVLPQLLQRHINLTHLNLSQSLAEDAHMGLVASALPALQVLDLAACKKITDAGLAACSQLVSLRSINVDKTNITGEGFSALTSLTALSEVEMGWCLRTTQEGCAAVARLPHLQRLAICRHQHSFCSLPELAKPGACPALTSLSITTSTGYEGMVQVLAQLTRLTHLDLSGTIFGTTGDRRTISFEPLRALTSLKTIRAEGATVQVDIPDEPAAGGGGLQQFSWNRYNRPLRYALPDPMAPLVV